jgi:hypothetical protein
MVALSQDYESVENNQELSVLTVIKPFNTAYIYKHS